MVTPLNVPREIRITADGEGCPVFVWIRNRQKRVARTRNVWRIDDEWWRREIARRYFELEMSDDSVITVFQDLVSGDWYRQRY